MVKVEKKSEKNRKRSKSGESVGEKAAKKSTHAKAVSPKKPVANSPKKQGTEKTRHQKTKAPKNKAPKKPRHRKNTNFCAAMIVFGAPYRTGATLNLRPIGVPIVPICVARVNFSEKCALREAMQRR